MYLQLLGLFISPVPFFAHDMKLHYFVVDLICLPELVFYIEEELVRLIEPSSNWFIAHIGLKWFLLLSDERLLQISNR